MKRAVHFVLLTSIGVMASLSVLTSSPLLAQVDCDANAILSVGSASAASGDVQVELRGSSLCEVTGFGLAIGHDPTRVEFVEATPGPFLTAHAGAQLLFVAEERNTQGFMLLFSAFDGTPPITGPPTSIPENTVLATLTYSILPGAAPGVAALRNENQVFGFPSISNVYTTEELSIQPILGSGSITVLGGEVDCDANAILSVGSASAESGEVTVELYGSSACEVTGFALAIGHDSTRVEFVSATPGVFLVSHAGSELFFLVEERNSNGFMSIFAFFDLTQPFTVRPRSVPPNTVLAKLTYRILPGAPPGQAVLRNIDRGFGFPPISNIFTAEDLWIQPVLTNGLITVTGGGGVDCDANAVLAVGTASAAGGEVQVELRGSSFCEVTGFSAAISHDPFQVEFVRATPGEFLNTHAGSDLLFQTEEHNLSGFMRLFGVFDGLGSGVPPTDILPNTPLATLTYRILPGASGQVVLRNADRPPTFNIFTTDGVSISPVLTDGTIFIGDGGGSCDDSAVLAVGSTSALSVNVQVELRGRSACDVTGFVLTIGHDTSRVAFTGAVPGEFLTSHAGDKLAFLADPRNAQGFALLFASFPLTNVPAGTRLATLSYSILPGAVDGQVVLSTRDRMFGFDNVFVTDNLDIHPALIDGSIVVGDVTQPPPPPPPPPTGDFAMTLVAPSEVEFAQGEFNVQLTGSSTKGLVGYSALIGYDPVALSMEAWDCTGTVWQDAELCLVDDDGNGTITIGAIQDRDGPVVTEGEDLPFLNLTFAGHCPGPTTISFLGRIDDNLLVGEDFVGHDAGNGLELTGVTIFLDGEVVPGECEPPPPPPPPPPPFSMSLEAPSSVELAQSEFEVKLTGSASRALLALSARIRYDPGVLSLASTDFTGTVWEDSLIDSVSDSGAGIIEVEALRRQADAVRPGVALLFLNLIFTPISRATSTTLSFSGGNNFVVDEFSIRHDAESDLALNGVTVTVGFVRGDSNSDGRVDITDAVRTLRYLFAGVAIACEDAADANDDENVNIADASYVLGYLFQGGPAVPAPFPASGLDPSGDALGCGR